MQVAVVDADKLRANLPGERELVGIVDSTSVAIPSSRASAASERSSPSFSIAAISRMQSAPAARA